MENSVLSSPSFSWCVGEKEKDDTVQGVKKGKQEEREKGDARKKNSNLSVQMMESIHVGPKSRNL
jgi:hypothetical protein